MGDYERVGCELIREALSARLDGEEEPVGRTAVDAHLAGCPACRGWLDDAAEVTRLARLGPAVAVPPVSADILAALPGRGRARLVGALRVLLGGFGLAQLALGLAQIGVTSASGHVHPPVLGTVEASHLWHESAAWNVAVGAGFFWIALRRTRPVGVIPMLTAFIVLLALLSAGDLVAGRVDPVRLLSHGFVVAGYLIVLLLSHRRLDPGAPPRARWRPAAGWRPALDDPAPEDVPSAVDEAPPGRDLRRDPGRQASRAA